MRKLAGRYELNEYLGCGGMGEVYRAVQTLDGGMTREVAVKLLLPEISRTDHYRRLFLDEARIALRLVHPCIVTALDCGERDGQLYLVMELVDGLTLQRLTGRLAGLAVSDRIRLACEIGMEICRALHHAHTLTIDGRESPVVHRDISPDNIMLTRSGHVKVMDFGVAAAGFKVEQTTAGGIKGKLAYMAPEQLRGLAVDRRADIFSTGAVLYELVTGRKLFGRDGVPFAEKVLPASPTDPSEERQGGELWAGFRELIERCVAPDPQRRCPDARRLLEELQALHQASVVRGARLDLMEFAEATFAEHDRTARKEGDPPPTEIVAVPLRRRPFRLRLLWPGLLLLSALVALGVTEMRERLRQPDLPPAVTEVIPETTPAEPAPSPSDRAGPSPALPPAAAGGEMALAADAPLTVRFVSIPWGYLTIDGVYRGETPRTEDLTPGRHRVVVENIREGKRFSGEITIRPGMERVDIRLK